SDNPHFGTVRNPWNLERSPGGSSGGSGAAVAANLVYMAMGSDTGGSIRCPAAYCGVVGLKPTYGRVSRHGVMPLSWSQDHMGPLTRSVRDAAAVLNAIAGYDRRDPESSRHPVVDFVPEDGCSIRGLRIGFAARYFEGLSRDVETCVRGAMARSTALGALVTPVETPDLEALNAVGRVILLAEAASVTEPRPERRASLGRDVLALLDQGTLVPATEYLNAQRLRRALAREFRKVWSEVDCLLLPTTPHAAPRIGQTAIRLEGREVDARLEATRLTRTFNTLGLPVLSMPCGLSADGLPVGLQIAGAAFDEATILRVAAALEDDGVGIPPCSI
ncbi:MAG TPA: amidase, partial [Bryobacteraceae bacterium]|nr:amidase [Bryobacteraceae bacterium]